MKWRAALLAVAITGIGGVLLWTYLRRFEAEASGGTPIGVLVALRTLEPGSLLRDEDIGVRWIPQAYVEGRAIRVPDRSRIVNLRLFAPVQAQQTLMWTDIVVASDDKRGVGALVQPGMRAVSIRAEGDASSMVRPGDRVDVIATFPQPGNADNRTGVVLLQNILVLGRANPGEDAHAGGMTHANADLALSVSLQNAQLLAVAADKGKLSVALRNAEDPRLQEGLADISSSILVQQEKRTVIAGAKPGPARVDPGAGSMR